MIRPVPNSISSAAIKKHIYTHFLKKSIVFFKYSRDSVRQKRGNYRKIIK